MNQPKNWFSLEKISQLDEIDTESHNEPILIFKHSTRCSISRQVLNQFKTIVPDDTKIYYLDLLSYREISHAIATRYEVTHQSPQLIVIKNKKAIYNASHSDIVMTDFSGFINKK